LLIDKNQGKKYFHSLYYNKDYDFSNYGLHLLEGSLDEIKNIWRALTKDKQYDRLFDEIEAFMDKMNMKRREKEGDC
jgi:hypothetical protein